MITPNTITINPINMGTLSLSLRWELSSVAWRLLLFISVLWVQSDVFQWFFVYIRDKNLLKSLWYYML